MANEKQEKKTPEIDVDAMVETMCRRRSRLSNNLWT